MSTRHINKVLMVITVFVMFIFTFAGCRKTDERMTEQQVPEDGRTVLTLGYFDYNSVSEQVKDYVDAFNQTNATYRIEIKDYSESEDCDTAFNLDVSAGKTPDIIVTAGERLDKLIHMGLLTDMLSLLDEDPELCRDDFMESVMSAWLEEEKLYYMAPKYHIAATFGKQEMVGKFSAGWTKEEMIDYAESLDVPLFYENDKMTMFNTFMDSGYSEFVDWNTGKAAFDSDVFTRILRYCDQGVKNSDRFPIGEEWVSEFRNGKYAVTSLPVSHFSDIEDITRVFGKDLCYVGAANAYRDTAGIFFEECFSISSKSKYQDIAWEFVRSLLTKDAQYQLCKDFRNLSVRKDVFAMMKKAAMATETYTDEYGTEIKPWQETSPTMEYTPLSQEEADLVEQLVMRAKHCIKVDKKIDDIVYDEVSAFFNGDCTLDRVGETINSRVETYMSENR